MEGMLTEVYNCNQTRSAIVVFYNYINTWLMEGNNYLKPFVEAIVNAEFYVINSI